MGNKNSTTDDKRRSAVQREFPFKGDAMVGQTSVFVPIWNGKGDVFTIQKMHPYDIPTHPLPEGCVLPGEAVHPGDVPAQVYNVTPADAEGYPQAGVFDPVRDTQLEDQATRDDDENQCGLTPRVATLSSPPLHGDPVTTDTAVEPCH